MSFGLAEVAWNKIPVLVTGHSLMSLWKTVLPKLRQHMGWIVVMAGCLATFINFNPFELYLGVSLIFGMSVALATLFFAGGPWGVIVAIPASLATMYLWGQPYSGSIFILEAIILTLCRNSRHGRSMMQNGYIIIADFLFWVALGAPLYYLTHVYFIGLDHADAITIAKKAVLNGVVNALIAYFIFSGFTLLRNRREKGRPTISIQAISLATTYSLIILIALLTAIHLSNRLVAIQAAEVANTFNRQSRYALSMLDSMSSTDENSGVTILMKSLDTEFMWQSTDKDSMSMSAEGAGINSLKTTHSDETNRILLSVEASRLAKHPDSIRLWMPRKTKEKMLLKRYGQSQWVAQIYSPDKKEFITLMRSSRPEFRILTDFYRSILDSIANSLFVGIILSAIISASLAREFNSVVRQGKKTSENPSSDENSQMLRLSPIQEIDNLALEVNNRTSIIQNSKREIEELNSIAQQQLSTAGEIQQCFLAKQPANHGRPDVSLFMRPAYNAGGDWYDTFDINGRIFLVVADTCDKGIGAALFMSVFRSLIRYAAQSFCSESNDGVAPLDKVIGSVNTYMSSEHGESAMFATVFLACIDQESYRLDYVLAGHEEPILLFASGESHQFRLGGPAIGLFPFSTYTVNSTSYDSGSILVGYTDGVVDARDTKNSSFGHQRLCNVINNQRESISGPTAKDISEALLQELDAHIGDTEQFDDITIAAVIL
jgi:serine phosphatase RsbU (regulator of sigma subunit)